MRLIGGFWGINIFIAVSSSSSRKNEVSPKKSREKKKNTTHMAAAKKKKKATNSTPSSPRAKNADEASEKEDASKLTVKELKARLEREKLPTDGSKKDLIERLEEAHSAAKNRSTTREAAARTREKTPPPSDSTLRGKGKSPSPSPTVKKTTTKKKKRGKSEEPTPSEIDEGREEKNKKPRRSQTPERKSSTKAVETAATKKAKEKTPPPQPPSAAADAAAAKEKISSSPNAKKTTTETKKAAIDQDDVQKTYETTMKRGACEDKVVEELIDEGFLERSVWPKILASTSKSEHPDEKSALAFAKCIVHRARNMNVPDAFATLSSSGSGDNDNEEGENTMALKMLVETLTSVAHESKESNEPEAIVEMITVVRFFNVLMNALENDMARKSALPLVSIQIWKSRDEKRLEMELKTAPADVQKKWQKLMKKEAKQESTKMQTRRNFWLSNLTVMFLNTLPVANVNEKSMAFCAYYLEFIVDLLAQLPTRRFVRALLGDANIFVKANLTINEMMSDEDGNNGGNIKLLKQLLEMAKDFYDFEVDDHTGDALSEEEIEARRSKVTHAFQRLLFKHWPDELKELALSSARMIETRSSLTKQLKNLESDQLRTLCCDQLKLVSNDDSNDVDFMKKDQNQFLIDAISFHFEKRQSRREMVNKLPLYPTEDILWDESLVPFDDIKKKDENSTNRSKKSMQSLPLALPKLNLQFLTFSDYLLRNFNLFRLEATHEIRDDVSDAVRRMQPSKDGKSFRGWARMAMAIAKDDPRHEAIEFVYIGKPRVGEEKPSKVRIKMRLNFSATRDDVFKEWDELKRFDVVFLVHAKQDAKYGDGKNVEYIRGAEIVDIRDEEGVPANEGFPEQPKDMSNTKAPPPPPDAMDEGPKKPSGYDRVFTLEVDCAQYQRDLETFDGDVTRVHEMYKNFNCVIRRRPKENNFKAILACIRDCLNQDTNAPEWLQDVFLGYGDPSSASPDALELEDSENNKKRTKIDFKDTFLDEAHLRESFPGKKIVFDSATPVPPFKVTFAIDDDDASSNVVNVESYVPPDPGPYPEDVKNQNMVRFTPTQVDAVKSGVREGLTLIVGPPGTGKTDVATQILHCLYHTNPNQRVVLITHSNAALNDLFQKIMIRDVPERYLLRLGRGEEDLTTDKDFSRSGRVDYMLHRRLELLEIVERLAMSIDETLANAAETCETAGFFWKSKVLALWERFSMLVLNNKETPVSYERIRSQFPFAKFFADVPGGYENLFGDPSEANVEYAVRKAKGCFRHLVEMFTELEECRFLELLKMPKDRAEYLLTKQAKIVAMTCTYAALKRSDFLDVNFKYDTVVFEEAAQILEIESFIPLALQRARDIDGHTRLKRVVMIGDHNQLPPVVKNQTFSKFCRMDQSCFARLVRSGVPNIVLDAQGRSRKQISKLYSWRYKKLDDLPHVSTEQRFQLANAGMAKVAQFIDCSSFAPESCPQPHYFQNLQEAEYLCSLYQWMRLCGYPAHSISILTTYRGQKHLLRDVFKARCDSHPLFGPPASISTVDKYQGQQNDVVLLSLVRTKHVGHLRDVRRLVVSLSRARLGVYVFGSQKIFENVDELKPALKTLMGDTKLEVIKGEVNGHISRKVDDAVSSDVSKSFKNSDEFASFIDACALEYKKAALQHLKNQQQ